jgi:hypothetical protein
MLLVRPGGTLRGPAFAAFVAASLCLVAACDSPLPTPPTPHAGNDVSGRWLRVDAATGRQGPDGWLLVQNGTNVEGTNLDDPFATVPYTRVLTGTVVGYEFTFTGTMTQFFPGSDPQRTTFGGTLTIDGETMAGQVSSVPPVGRPASGPMRLVRVASR